MQDQLNLSKSFDNGGPKTPRQGEEQEGTANFSSDASKPFNVLQTDLLQNSSANGHPPAGSSPSFKQALSASTNDYQIVSSKANGTTAASVAKNVGNEEPDSDEEEESKESTSKQAIIRQYDQAMESYKVS